MQPTLNLAPDYNDPLTRGIYAIPFPDKFFNLLQDHLHTLAENLLFQGSTGFSVFLTAVPRVKDDRIKRTDVPKLFYVGCDRQSELLLDNQEEGKLIWEQLKKEILLPDNSKINRGLYDDINKGKYSLQDIQTIYTLKNYFSGELNNVQKIEKEVIGRYFDLDKDVFLAVPIIGFGELDGIAYIIFQRKFLRRLPWRWIKHGKVKKMQMDYSLTWTLCRQFVAEYDGMFLDWNNVGGDMEKIAAIEHLLNQTILKGDEYFNQKIKNPIYKQLRLRDYYRRHREYYQQRLELGESIPNKIYEQYLTNAVTAILVDSYAHNVSAHALSTLSWWYMRRASQLKQEEVDWDSLMAYLRFDELIDNKIIDDFEKAITERRKVRKLEKTKSAAAKFSLKDGSEIINYPGSLARELAQLLRFITEKGAFWSGVIRDDNSGGKVSSLYSVLWYDFIKNPFYLGTIAKSEDILHIKVKVVIYEDEEGSKHNNSRIVKSFLPENKGILGGVNLMAPENPMTRKKPEDKEDTKEEIRHHDDLSAFVYQGDNFLKLRKTLKKIKIYFPGGVVGRHTFFTMIENEIRNIKHYTGSILKKAQDEGLTVTIGIQACNLPGSDAHEMYRISIWLEVPTEMQKEDGSGKHLVEAKWDMLSKDIVDEETHAPKLGGTYQDKICAAFLLNGVYSHVQRGDKNPLRDKSKDSSRDKRYYPYIRVGCSPVKSPGLNEHTDYRISYDIIKEGKPDTSEFPKMGYLKKMFHVWRGEHLLDWSDNITSNMDNPSRFYLVRTNEINNELLSKLRRDLGLVRVVGNLPDEPDEKRRFAQAYNAWLWKLCGGEENLYAFTIYDNDRGLPLHFIALKSDVELGITMYSYPAPYSGEQLYKEAQNIWQKDKDKAKEWFLRLAHKAIPNSARQQDEIRFRSHGIFKNFFFPTNHKHAAFDDSLIMEFFEVMVTRVCIFDNRVYQRMRLPEADEKREQHRAFLRESLKISVHNERRREENTDQGDWKSFLDDQELEFMSRCNFLVMHLSFIESIIKDKYPTAGIVEKTDIVKFIEEEILPITHKRDNFFFVVTTGRGRNDWWASLKNDKDNNISTFALFRPIESLLSAVENSIGMHDDIELKYRIVKYLYGS